MTPNGPTGKGSADVVMREGRRLETLIDDLSWLARHDEHRAEIQCTDVDLDDLLFEESQRVRLLSSLGVDTTMIQPTRVKGDPAMMKRMIRNVVDNATRYASHELRFDSHYEDEMAVVTVADDGEGVDVSQSARSLRPIRSSRSCAESSVRRNGSRARHREPRSSSSTRGHGATSSRVPLGSKIELRVRRDGRRTSTGSWRTATGGVKCALWTLVNSPTLSPTPFRSWVCRSTSIRSPASAPKRTASTSYEFYGLGRGGHVGRRRL